MKCFVLDHFTALFDVCGICFFHWVVSEVCLCTILEHAVLVLEGIGVRSLVL